MNDLRLENFTGSAHVFISRPLRLAHGKDAPLTFTQESPPSPKRAPRRRATAPVIQPIPEPREVLLARTLLQSLEDAKAEDIVSIDLTGRTTIADLMIIASGRSNVHVGAIADRVARACREAGFSAPKVEGVPHCDWVLLDAGDAIIHIFKPDTRQFYNLEKMWSADRPAETRIARPS